MGGVRKHNQVHGYSNIRVTIKTDIESWEVVLESMVHIASLRCRASSAQACMFTIYYISIANLNSFQNVFSRALEKLIRGLGVKHFCP